MMKPRILLLLCALVVLIGWVAASSSSEEEVELGMDVPDGIWVSRGNGWVLKSGNWQLQGYEETAISCLPRQDLLEFIQDIQVDGDILTVKAEGSITEYIFDKVTTPPGFCAQGITPYGNDYTRNALQVFDILVQTFQEHYPYFHLREIDDWRSFTAPIRKTLSPDSSNDELIDAFSSILLPLDDDSAFVATRRGGVQKSFPLYTQFEQEFNDQNTEKKFDIYVNVQLRRWTEIINQYMDGNLNGQRESVLWGRFKDANVGYINLFGQSLNPDGDDDKFFATFQAALESFTQNEALVLDIRGVEGDGSDVIALRLASYFSSESLPVFSKRAVNAAGFTDAVEHSTEPSATTQFEGKVILIASGATVGPSELFTMIMSQLPQVTILGRNTSGAIGASDRLIRMLPNEWIFGLANHEYMTPDGAMYEKLGVPPDVVVDTDLLPLHERVIGIDSWLETALDLAGTSLSPETDTE
jgi:carboxyl-terminal processing protease